MLNRRKKKRKKTPQTYDLGTSLDSVLEISTECIHIKIASISERGKTRPRRGEFPLESCLPFAEPYQPREPEEPNQQGWSSSPRVKAPHKL